MEGASFIEAMVPRIMALIPLVPGLGAGLAFLALTCWRPAAGCGLLVLLTPLTTGLGRGTIVPFLRPNEALLLALLAGLALHRLHHPRQRSITSLDLAVGSFAVGTVVVPSLVLLVSNQPGLLGTDTLRDVLAPAQFLLVYLVFSRTPFSSRGVRMILNLAMLAGVVVSLVAIAELVDVAGIRELMAMYYPVPVTPSWDPVYRPFSTLGHYSAVGAFGAMNFTLALSLATVRHPAFSRSWLSVVMVANLAAVVVSLTWAPLLVLPLVAAIVLWHGRHVPRELGVTVGGLAIALVLFWSAVSERIAQQGLASSVGLVIPQTFQTRLDHWQEFFLPAIADHVWLGSGTIIPSIVPTPLTDFVDNEYLRDAFRAGVVGLMLLLVMLLAIALTGWRSRRAGSDPTARSLGSTCLALVVFLALIGVTAEYLFFGGVSQEFAMLVGLLAARNLVEARAEQRSATGSLTSHTQSSLIVPAVAATTAWIISVHGAEKSPASQFW